jgi:hypothetical protein
MKMTLTILMTLLTLTLAFESCADTTTTHQDKEYGWLQDGMPVPDSDNIKSKNGFGVQMWITKDESFFDNWNKPETPNLTFTKTAIRNEKIFIIFLFINPGRDQSSKTDVVTDVLIKDPNGKVYGKFTDIEIWQRIDNTPRNNIQLGVGHLGLVIENNEQLGTYKVEAEVKDRIKNVSLKLQTEFTAGEK